ncbi:MAG TPA: MFS transporter [Streptosporangiaceae bacterium]|nr:MFS transporter [Streptosporangiaceae bacterium]
MAAIGVPSPARTAGSWRRVAVAMFAVGWGANQFSPLLIEYRHELSLSAGTLAGVFAIYAATLIPGLLIGGPVSDRIGRRPVVLPFVALSPVATLMLMLGPRSLPVIGAGRALAGLCSGVVFGSATAWVQELSDDPAASARRSAVALSAGFAVGPAVAAVLAEWAPDPLVLPYLPHVVIGLVAVLLLWPTPETVRRGTGAGETGQPAVRRRWPPQAVRTARFWLAVAPAAPWVFGAASLAFVVLPQEVTRQGSLSVGYAGLITTITVASGIAVQPLARRLEARHRLAGEIAGLACAAVGTGVAIAVVGAESRAGAVGCAVAFGLAYGLCLVSGLRECERLADRGQHGAVVACFYALTYLGFGVPYLVDALNGLLGRDGTFTALAIVAAVSAAWTLLYTARLGSRVPARALTSPSSR